MAKTTTRRKKTSSTADAAGGLPVNLQQIADAHRYSIQAIGDTEAACNVQTGADGEPQIVMAIIELPGRNRWGGQAFGMVQRAQEDGSRWSCGDTEGHLQHEFPTVHEAVAALRDPARRKQMREYTDLVRQMQEVTRKVEQFPTVEGALPNFWQNRWA